MKKIIVCGDLHGRNHWKEINSENYDKIIFIGDYCDSYNKSNSEIYDNLEGIIKFKRDNFDKVILLFGNHDIQYAYWDTKLTFGTNGFRPEAAHMLYTLFRHNRDCFQMAYQINNYLFTHAGVSNMWYNQHKITIEEVKNKFETENLAETFNAMATVFKYNKILHQLGKARGSCINKFGGITWADRSETINKHLNGYFQVVGHTPCPDQEFIKVIGNNEGIVYIDVLSDSNPVGKFYELVID